MRRITLRQLEYFTKAADLGNIARAAKEMNVSPPSLTTAISNLEDELGVDLLVRHHARGVALAPAGEKIIKQVRKILNEIDLLNDLATDLKSEVRGPLSVGCMNAFAEVVFPSLCKTYETEYPHMKVVQFALGHSEIVQFLRESKLDVALSFDFNAPADLKFIPLVELPPFAVVYESHPLANQIEVSMEQLDEHPMVLLDLPHCSEYYLSLFDRKRKSSKIIEKARNAALMRSMVANGYGFSIANVKPQIDQSPDGKRLKFIPIGGQVRGLKLGLLVPKNKFNSSLIESFTEHCKTSIESGLIPGLGV